MCPSVASGSMDTALTQPTASSTLLPELVGPVPTSLGASSSIDSGSTPAPVAADVLCIPLVQNDHRMVT
jgi:hypothetical protein